MKPEEKPKKLQADHDRAGVSQEFIQKLSEELQAIQRDRSQHR